MIQTREIAVRTQGCHESSDDTEWMFSRKCQLIYVISALHTTQRDIRQRRQHHGVAALRGDPSRRPLPLTRRRRCRLHFSDRLCHGRRVRCLAAGEPFIPLLPPHPTLGVLRGGCRQNDSIRMIVSPTASAAHSGFLRTKTGMYEHLPAHRGEMYMHTWQAKTRAARTKLSQLIC